jgi:hypothetical protein
MRDRAWSHQAITSTQVNEDPFLHPTIASLKFVGKIVFWVILGSLFFPLP